MDDAHDGRTPRRFVSLCGPIAAPPLSEAVRRQVGFLIWQLQTRVSLQAPHFKAIPSIGSGAGELRVSDGANRKEWRLFIACISTEVIALEIHEKRTQKTPKQVIDLCRKRLAAHLAS